jgi:hypothetical protein
MDSTRWLLVQSYGVAGRGWKCKDEGAEHLLDWWW